MERAARVRQKTANRKSKKKKVREEKVKEEKEEVSSKAIKISQNFTQIQNKPESVDRHGNETWEMMNKSNRVNYLLHNFLKMRNNIFIK